MRRPLVLALMLAAATAGARLGDGHVGCPLSDSIEPFDLDAPAAGMTIPLSANSHPDDLTMTPDGRHVWVTHGGEPLDVQVVDCATDTIIQRMPIGSNEGGVAFSDDSVYAVVTSRLARNVMQIPAQLYFASGTTPLPGEAGNIAMDSATGLFYVVEWRPESLRARSVGLRTRAHGNAGRGPLEPRGGPRLQRLVRHRSWHRLAARDRSGDAHADARGDRR